MTYGEMEAEHWVGYARCRAKDDGGEADTPSTPAGNPAARRFIAGCPYFSVKRDAVRILEVMA